MAVIVVYESCPLFRVHHRTILHTSLPQTIWYTRQQCTNEVKLIELRWDIVMLIEKSLRCWSNTWMLNSELSMLYFAHNPRTHEHTHLWQYACFDCRQSARCVSKVRKWMRMLTKNERRKKSIKRENRTKFLSCRYRNKPRWRAKFRISVRPWNHTTYILPNKRCKLPLTFGTLKMTMI